MIYYFHSSEFFIFLLCLVVSGGKLMLLSQDLLDFLRQSLNTFILFTVLNHISLLVHQELTH
jgi:hypothetical protein